MRATFTLLLLLTLVGYRSHAQIVSDFTSGADGWAVGDQNNSGSSPGVITHHAGGYISSVVVDGQPRFWYAPAKFLGNRAYTSYGETLSFDLQTSTAVPEHSLAGGDLWLTNASSQSIFLPLNPLPGQSPAFTHYTVTLDETANWKQGSMAGPTASRELVIAVLSNLQTMRIFMQWKFAGNITGGIDNVVMNVHPPAPPAPVITSFTPVKASPGSSVTITGSGFGATASNNLVYFGGVKGTIESANATQIVVKVPNSADYARLEVINLSNNLSNTSNRYFVPTFATAPGATIITGSFDQYTQYNRTLGFMTHGDLNGDGKNEMIMSRDGFISVFENTSTTGTIDANSFGPRLDLSPSAAYGYAEIGVDDLDNDGKLDIFVAIRDNPDQGRIVVLPNIHTSGPITASSFGPFIDVTVPPYTTSAAHSADLDGDGKPELLSWGSSCGANPVYILQNISVTGDIRFVSQVSLSGVSSCGGRYQTTDLDGDGKIDIVQSGENNTRIFRNISTPGTLNFEAPFDLGDGGTLTTLGDLDNDGKPEIVFASGGVKIYKNISTAGSLSVASFNTVTVLSGGINQAKIADINGDGKPDIVTSLNGAGLGVFQNVTPDGQINSGSFRPIVSVYAGGTAASNLDVADFDFDGKPDLVSNNGGFTTVAVVRNATSMAPTVTSLSTKAAPPGSTITITGTNFNATAANIHVWFGAARGSVSNATSTSLEVVVPTGASYDQVSVALSGYTVFSNDFFTPTFSGGSDFTAGAFVMSFERTIATAGPLEVGDFDVDGKVDILSDNAGPIGVHRNVGAQGVIDASTFAASYNVGSASNVMRKGDLDGDGKLDLVVNHLASRNISNAASPNPIIFDTFIGRDNSNPTASDFSNFRDLNNDGKIDIAFSGGLALAYAATNQTRAGGFYDYNSTPASFGDHATFPRPVGGGLSVVADFDGDGFNDMITTNPTNNTLSIFLNTKQTTPLTSALFNARVDLVVGASPSGIVAADFDSDGKPDIAVTNSTASNATISIFRNTSTVGTISFARQDFAAANSPGRIAAGDMDGDGQADLVVNNQGAGVNSFSVFRNKMSGSTLDASSFAPKVDYATVNSPRGLAIADVDGDMRPDVILTRATTNILTVFKNLMPFGPNISFTNQPVSTSACENGTTTYSVIATGANNLVYTWQVFNTTNSQFENLSANATFSGVNTAALTVSLITAAMNNAIYRVKISGDGAAEKFSDQATLTVSSSPAAPATTGETACKGSSLTLTAGGGTDGNYRWYDSPTSQQAINGQVNSTFHTPVIFATTTFYAAVANATGCASARTAAVATITPITKPAITSGGTMLCGVNVVTISGPAGFAAYNWSNGASTQNIDVSFAGSYALIVEDANGCQSLASDPVVITTGSVAKPVINASKIKLCSADDEIILSGPAGFAGYEWSTGATTPTLTVTDEGVYSVKVVNASGCRSESSDDFEVTIGAEIPTISVGADVLVSSPAKTYQWYYDEFKIPDGTKQFLTYNPFQYGAYTVSVTDLSDCAATSAVFVNLVTAAEHPQANDIVYPNPFTEVLVVNVDADEARLFDATGKSIKALTKGENDVSYLARGLYLLKIRKGNEFKTIKVSK
jgi:hypothetical protein